MTEQLTKNTIPFPRDCRIETVNLSLSETRAVTLHGLSLKVVIFELEDGFKIISDDDLSMLDNLLPWYCIEELTEILNWIAQFREPVSGNENLNFDQLWAVAQQIESSYQQECA